MKKMIALTALYACSLGSFAQQAESPDTLLARKQFFQLRNRLAAQQEALPAAKKLYYNSFLDNFFYRPDASDRHIDQLLQQHRQSLTDAQAVALLKLKIDNLVKACRYKEAYAVSGQLLTDYSRDLSEEDAKDIRNSAIIWKSLQSVAPQQTHIAKDTRIPFTRDMAGLLNIPVHIGDTVNSYIFDTGANISTITESHARRNGLDLMDGYFEVGAVTGLTVKARAAVAREMRIGDIIVKNAVFMVMPDSCLSFAGGRYVINGIIGFPVIAQLGEVRINKADYLEVPRRPVPAPFANFGLDKLTPVVNITVKQDSLPFTFDTGASSTSLNESFFRRYEREIVAAASKDTIGFGGAGGIKATGVYRLPEITLQLGGKQAALRNVPVKTATDMPDEAYYYGNLGQDMMKQFGEMVINFRYMYVSFR